MPIKTASQITNELRDSIIKEFLEYRLGLGDDARMTKGNKFMFPCTDEKGEERFCEVTISIPKGNRDGEGYDGYAEAEAYLADQEEKRILAEQRNKEREEKKAIQFAKAEKARAKKAEAMAKRKEKLEGAKGAE